MLVTTTVDVKHLIDRGALVVNPTFIPKTKEEYTISSSSTSYATLMLDTINMVMEATIHIESNRINKALGDSNIGGI